MLGVLLKQQFLSFLSSFRIGKRKNGVATRRSLGSTLLIAGILGFCFIYFAVLFYFLFYSLFSGLREGENTWLGFAVVGILVFLLDFILTIFTAKSQLFEAKDNDLLLSLPVRPRDILISRMLMILLTDYAFELLILIPGYAAYVVVCGFHFGGLICMLLTAVAMPLLALSLSCLVGWLLSFIASRMKNATTLNTILSLLLFAAYMWLCMSMQSVSTLLLTNAEKLAPIIKTYLYPFYCLGDACANGNFLSALLYIVIMAVPFIITGIILARTFLSLITRKQGVVRRAYRESKTRVKPLMAALVGRELRRIFSSVTYLINAGSGLILMVMLAVSTFFAGDTFTVVADAMGIPANVLLPAIFTAGLALVGGMSFFTAPSVSLEGRNIYDLKALPLSGRSLLLAKLYAHLIIVFPVSLVSSVLAIIALPCNITMGVLLVLVPMIFETFIAVMGLVINLAFPRFDWDSETAVVKQSLAVTLTMLTGIFGGMLLIGAAAVLFIFIPAIPVWGGILLASLIPAGLTVALISYLCRRGDHIVQKLG